MQKPMMAAMAAALLCILLTTTPLLAVGLGFYGLAEGGKNYRPYNTIVRFGGGITVDTAVAKKTIFNYRLNLGVDAGEDAPTEKKGWVEKFNEYIRNDVEHYGGNYARFHMINNFGFGVVRTERVRFWLGPQLFLTYTAGGPLNGIYGGLGLVMGVNIHCGDLISLGFDAAARGLAIVKVTVHSGNSGSSTTTRVGGRITGAANVYVLFRIDDRY